MRSLKHILFFLLLSAGLFGQGTAQDCDTLLAKKEYQAGIFCLEQQLKLQPTGPAYEKLLNAYLLVNDSSKALKLTRKESKDFGHLKPQYYVDYWHLSKVLSRKGPDYSVIENLTESNPFSVRGTAQQLERYGYYQEAIDLYLLAERIKPQVNTAFERGQLHAQIGQYPLQYDAYFTAISLNPGYLSSVKAKLAQNLSMDPDGAHSQSMKSELYKWIRKSNSPVYEQLLLYVLRQEGNFVEAFDYLRAKAKTGALDAFELYSLGEESAENSQFTLAASIYNFLLAHPKQLEQIQLKGRVLSALFDALETTGDDETLGQLFADYPLGSVEQAFDWERKSIEYHYYHSPQAMVDLEAMQSQFEQLRVRYRSPYEQGITYASMANAALSAGYFDEALLDFARAETLLGDSDEGDEARLQKALCAFYRGDILWAKSQFEVLLQSTSKSIANDAMENALLISANSVEDTAMEGLLLLVDALMFETRHQWDSAAAEYQRLRSVLIANELYDDVLLKLGKIQLKLQQWQEAQTTFFELQRAAGEGMWKEEAFYYYAYALSREPHPDAAQSLENYLLQYPSGLYSEEARQFYRTFAP
jgi:hypothetical protein